MIRKGITAAILAIWLALSLGGCGYPELYERVIIHGIGVDWDGEGYRVTVRSSATSEDEELFTCQGSTVLEALSNLSLTTGREPFYSHNYLVVFGMDCAERGLDECLDFFVRYYNTRPAVKVFLAEGDAEEILSTEKDGKPLKMGELQALGQGGKYNGQAAQVEILDFVNGVMSEGSSAVMPVLRPSEEGVEVAATAYFDSYQVAGMLTHQQTRGWLAAMDQLDMGELVVEGKDAGTATLSLREVSGEIKAQVEGRPVFHIDIQVDADVSSADGGADHPDFFGQTEAAAQAMIEDEVRSAIREAVEEKGCDIFGFGNQLYREYPDYWWQNAERWPDLMKECQYQVSASVKVRRLEEENRRGLNN